MAAATFGRLKVDFPRSRRAGALPRMLVFETRIMKILLSCVVLALELCHSAPAIAADKLPFANGEVLVYEITWPSGLSLGEARFTASSGAAGWNFQAQIQASLPTMEIRDEYRSSTDASLCSTSFEKDARHGKRIVKEEVSYDQQKHLAHRKTLEGGHSEVQITPCVRDGLAFLYALRHELGQGRVPPPDDINFGAQYQVSLTYAESVEVAVGDEHVKADRMLVDLTGPASHHSFEILVGKDSARTPVLMRVPFDLGTFTLKLVK